MLNNIDRMRNLTLSGKNLPDNSVVPAGNPDISDNSVILLNEKEKKRVREKNVLRKRLFYSITSVLILIEVKNLLKLYDFTYRDTKMYIPDIF
jgi:hypothetical protein